MPRPSPKADGGRIDREGIHIDPEVAEAVAIEEELDADTVGPYRFPSPSRRRTAGWVYVGAALLVVTTIDTGWLIGSGLMLVAAWHFLSTWPLAVDEHGALTGAAAAVDFTVGHASAAVRFQGWRSRPRWSVVLYSAAEPPDRRALVVVDGVTGELVERPFLESLEPAEPAV